MTEQNERPIIAFDTSTAALAAAITNGQQVLGEIQSFAERNHSVYIVVHLKQLLKECGVSGEELGAVAVGRGPGSYTGMRIAVSAAKTLAWVWNKPLIGISSLEALAYGAWHRGLEIEAGQASSAELKATDWVLPIMDARRGQVYTAGYAMSASGEWSHFNGDGVRLMHNWVDQITEQATDPSSEVKRIWVVGDLSLHEEEANRLRHLCETIGIEVRMMSYELEGRWVAYLGRLRLEAGDIDDTHTLTPNYTQLTEAEVNLKAKESGELPS
ncbi:MAG: tRNA (adenosine(37)-N6)-threonylcarbamoyltransferase complex dimerization subunit type 1 TsaB [Candidatus Pristimantibacillus sp.]